MHNQRLLVVLLVWYNSLILLGSSSMESSISTVKFPRRGIAFLNSGDWTAGFLGWENTVLEEELVESLG